MKLKKICDSPATSYPSYEDYRTNRREFLEKMAKTATVITGGLVLSACNETRTAGEPPAPGSNARLSGKIRAPRATASPAEDDKPAPSSEEADASSENEKDSGREDSPSTSDNSENPVDPEDPGPCRTAGIPRPASPPKSGKGKIKLRGLIAEPKAPKSDETP